MAQKWPKNGCDVKTAWGQEVLKHPETIAIYYLCIYYYILYNTVYMLQICGNNVDYDNGYDNGQYSTKLNA